MAGKAVAIGLPYVAAGFGATSANKWSGKLVQATDINNYIQKAYGYDKLEASLDSKFTVKLAGSKIYVTDSQWKFWGDNAETWMQKHQAPEFAEERQKVALRYAYMQENFGKPVFGSPPAKSPACEEELKKMNTAETDPVKVQFRPNPPETAVHPRDLKNSSVDFRLTTPSPAL